MHKNDVAAILTIIVGIGALATDAAFGQEVSTLFGPAAPKILAVVGLISTLGSTILRVYGSPSGAAK